MNLPLALLAVAVVCSAAAILYNLATVRLPVEGGPFGPSRGDLRRERASRLSIGAVAVLLLVSGIAVFVFAVTEPAPWDIPAATMRR